MKSFKHIVSGIALVFLVVTLTGCNVTTERWAYNHETDKEILALSSNGKAVFKDEKYKYTKDDSFINLTDKDGNTTSLRYYMDGDAMILYESSTYQYAGEGEPDGVVGIWLQDNNWSYQFNADGKFSEDNIFFGFYSVDEANSSIKLMYDEPLQDAILYYHLNGNELTIEYPWTLVHLTDKDDAVIDNGTQTGQK